jgi:NADPH-dependent ferric siderophore reductase
MNDKTDNSSCDTCGANLTDGSGDGFNGHWQNCQTLTLLTIDDLQNLADLLRAVQAGAKMKWYPAGTDSADHPMEVVLRQFTNRDRMYWPADRDIRDAYVWVSGIMEHWMSVRRIVRALSNHDGHLGMTEPMATIHYKD